MKILKLESYYHPEKFSSIGLITDQESAYINAGFEIEIYCPTPTRGITQETRNKYKRIKYEEKQNGMVHVHRFAMIREGENPIQRALRYVLVNLIQYIKGSRAKNIDVILGSSTPPTQGVLCGLVAAKLSKKYKKKVPFIYNVQDVFPDSLVTTGLAREGSILWKIGRKIEQYTYSHCDKIIVISESIKNNLLSKGVPESKLEVINNWVDTDAVKPILKEQNKLYAEFNIPGDKFLVVYAGNFGAAQGADIILNAAEMLKENTEILFVIFGGGAGFEDAKTELKRRGLENVIVNPLLPQDRVSEVYSLGNAALITCRPGVGNSGMPSKTWSIMACNTPIIASFDTKSELADIIKKANAGICVKPGDAAALAKAILDSCGSDDTVCNSRQYVMEFASKTVCTQRYVDVVNECVKKRCVYEKNSDGCAV